MFPLLCKAKHEENTSLLILSDTKARAGLSIFKATAIISMYHSMAAPLKLFVQTAFSLKSAAGICNHVNPNNLSGILSQWDIISMAYCHGRTTNGASCTSYKFVACYKIAQSFNHNFKNGSICIHHLQVVFILKPTALL